MTPSTEPAPTTDGGRRLAVGPRSAPRAGSVVAASPLARDVTAICPTGTASHGHGDRRPAVAVGSRSALHTHDATAALAWHAAAISTRGNAPRGQDGRRLPVAAGSRSVPHTHNTTTQRPLPAVVIGRGQRLVTSIDSGATPRPGAIPRGRAVHPQHHDSRARTAVPTTGGAR